MAKEVGEIRNRKEYIHQALLYERKRNGTLQKKEIKEYSFSQEMHEGYECELPAQVHEILIAHDKIKDPVETHSGNESLEVSKSDWLYRMEFRVLGDAKHYWLKCNGLDTIVDVYLNGNKIGAHHNMFYPFEVEIFPECDHWNVLLFHFHSPVRYLEQMKELHKDDIHIDPAHYIRKAPHDFEDFLGMKPYFATVGIFDHVVIESLESGSIQEVAVNYTLSPDLTFAMMQVQVTGKLFQEGAYRIRCVIEDESQNIMFTQLKDLGDTEMFDIEIQTEQMAIDLWWPIRYGNQTLYFCKVYLEGMQIIESVEKQIGFRSIEFKGAFDLKVNGVPVKLWGANLVPMNGLTHCFNTKRAEKIMWFAQNANMNILRFWGGGEPYPDELYSMADRMGILLWGEFFHKWGMYPEEEEHLESYRKEAVYMLKAFRHHPALIMWCGGNESQMGAELDFPGQPYVGTKIFKEYERLCKKLDKDKYFHVNSPMKGAFVNDPREGDFHGWNHLWYVPYDQYPVMFSENSRVSPPILKSLKKYMKDPEELWPAGFESRKVRFEDELLPPAWMELKAGPEPYWCSPVEQFYDATNPQELIYQCQAAHGKLMKLIGERLRRGRPTSEKMGERRCKGQLIWKLNDSWPQIFCSLLDYDLEVGIPYYTVKRVYEAIQVSFAIEENITIWATNDSNSPFCGIMEFVLFHPRENKIVSQFTKEVEVLHGESIVICDLDHFTQFKRESLLYACLKDKEGKIVARNYEFVEIERNFYFPDAVVTLEREGAYIVVSTDQFARCITLEANCSNGKESVVFEDNYFDLLPFEKRKIKIKTKSSLLTITAKPFYSTKGSVIKEEK